MGNIKTSVFTQEELRDFIQKRKLNNLKEKIHYFSYDDLSSLFCSKDYIENLKFIVSYTEKELVGICKFSYYSLSEGYAISYISTHEDYKNRGVAKAVIEELFKFFKSNFPNNTLSLSGYSINGWKYIRKYILMFSQKYNVRINEKPIEYVTEWTEKNRELFDESRKQLNF